MKPYTKSRNRRRTISLPPPLGSKLWAAYADGTGPMFATRTGRRLSARNLNRTLETAALAPSVPHVSPHTLRHVHDSTLLDNGWPIADVADRLGDDVATVRATYEHALKDSDRDLSFLEIGDEPADATDVAVEA